MGSHRRNMAEVTVSNNIEEVTQIIEETLAAVTMSVPQKEEVEAKEEVTESSKEVTEAEGDEVDCAKCQVDIAAKVAEKWLKWGRWPTVKRWVKNVRGTTKVRRNTAD